MKRIELILATWGQAKGAIAMNIFKISFISALSLMVSFCASTAQANIAPLADAGPDQTVLENSWVTLDGSGSFDPDADAITHSWTQTSGDSITLDLSDPIYPSFTAALAGDYSFELVVSDDSLSSPADEVRVTVEIPEPATLVMLTLGGLSLIRRRK